MYDHNVARFINGFQPIPYRVLAKSAADDELNDLGSPDTNTVAATRAASLSKVQELLNRNKNK